MDGRPFRSYSPPRTGHVFADSSDKINQQRTFTSSYNPTRTKRVVADSSDKINQQRTFTSPDNPTGTGGVFVDSSDEINRQRAFFRPFNPTRTEGVFAEEPADDSSVPSTVLRPLAPLSTSETGISASNMISEGDRASGSSQRDTERAPQLLDRHPTSHGELKVTIESVLQDTEWPPESKEAAEDLLRIVQGISGSEPNFDLEKATEAMRDVWQQVKEASLTYDMQKRGPIGHAKAFLGGSAKMCTRVLTACRERPALLASRPETAETPSDLPSGHTWRRFLRPREASTIGPSDSVDDVGTQITWISPTPVKVNGHFCDVFLGIHSRVGRVALKRPRIGAADNKEDVVRRFQREAETWEKLQHPHILEYLGTFQRDHHFYFVSPFIENGTLVEYIELHLSVNRIKLLYETADAIAYLHQQDVVHGDIKASKILIGGNGQVLLCDFGLTRTTDFRTSTAMRGAGTLRWQSPELWDGGSKSFKSDVYAFSMTIAEVLTGEAPFPDLQTDGAVIRAVLIEGMRPSKNPAVSSDGLSYEGVWAVAEACWPAVPEERISMTEAVQRIQEDPALAGVQEV